MEWWSITCIYLPSYLTVPSLFTLPPLPPKALIPDTITSKIMGGKNLNLNNGLTQEALNITNPYHSIMETSFSALFTRRERRDVESKAPLLFKIFFTKGEEQVPTEAPTGTT
ncbi:hypothetical protein NPIL_460921 [Nephila pilipes]|uniref:Uncharacterized protein n=1 Tax=Nephila pilipes TaxID=299642 RepID=A0A8X6TH49_NEPPI|nr:hypothetical protein NPIL_460921 [Nephila pilipes]